MLQADYSDVFLEELDEQLQIMEEELLRVEQEGYSDEGVNRLFRSAHTIKGSSAAMGLTSMAELTHEMEQVMDGLRKQELALVQGMVDDFLLCLDTLHRLKEDFVTGADSTDIQPLVERLQRWLRIDSEDSLESEGDELHTWRLHIRLTDTCEMKWARATIIHNHLKECGRILEMTPSLETVSEVAEMWLSLATSMTMEELELLLDTMLDIEEIKISPLLSEQDQEVQPTKAQGASAASLGNEKKRAPSIRVNLDRLDHIMNLIGELVIDQTRIREVQNNLSGSLHNHPDVKELKSVSEHITGMITELQDSVMKVRMLPIEQLYNRFPRMIRDLSRNLGKDIELNLLGGETELDRTLIDELGDPLIHLIRNAVDHGIEEAEVRLQRGKPAAGEIKISASHEGNQVLIVVEDDGAGIHPEKIAASAVRKGLLTEEEASGLSAREAVHLIFKPGFSTATQVSEVSGRGVGMDIVRSNIERLNGLIDIETEWGKGTRFTIRLPLTLAIITGSLVSVQERTYIVPMSSVAEIVRVEQKEIETVQGREVLVIRDRILPVVWLHDLFRITRSSIVSKAKVPIVIIGSAEKRIALAVDQLLGNQEVVIKSMGSFIGKVPCISGSTILGNGQVALILDVADIVNSI